MKRISDLGAIMQLAFVTDDIEEATLYWTKTIGVGPFFRLDDSQRGADYLRYRGAPCRAVYHIRIGYWADMQIELIQQRNDEPSIYSEWRVGNGLHHSCILVDDMDEALGVCAESGAVLLQEASLVPHVSHMLIPAADRDRFWRCCPPPRKCTNAMPGFGRRRVTGQARIRCASG